MEHDVTEPRQEKPAKSHRRLTVIGVCGIILIVFGGFSWCLSAVAHAKSCARRARCMSQLRQIGMACKMYAMDNNDRYPMNLSSCATNYIQVPKLFICTLTGKQEGTIETVDQWSDYILVPGLTTNDPPGTILAYERLRNHKEGGNVLSLDGSVEWRSAKDYSQLKTKTGRVLSSE